MENQHGDLLSLGWSDWFEQRIDCKTSDELARVVAVDRDLWLLTDSKGVFRAVLAGSYLHNHLPHELPCVGDWVCVKKEAGDSLRLIHSVLERKTALRRKSAGDAVEYQMIAANVDYVIIVQSCHFDFNLKRLERYLVMVRDGGAEPYILLTKIDLVEPSVLESQLSSIHNADISVPILTLSNVTQDGVNEFKKFLKPGKTYCFVGSSGVGKSTLINQLMGREQQETKTVSGTGEGRHTTVRRELLILESGALVIDNPGMREFGILNADEGMNDSFADIARLASQCRYRNCTHANEPQCAVVAAVESGELSREHYENYLKLKQESEFYDLSYAEKRKKDRDFGKYIKTAKKSFKDR